MTESRRDLLERMAEWDPAREDLESLDEHEMDAAYERFARRARAGESKATSRRGLARWGLISVVGVAAVGGGAIVVASEDSNDKPVVAPPGVPASECPEANAVFRDFGLSIPDEYSTECPPAEEVRHNLEDITADIPDRRRNGIEESSGNQDQLDEFRERYSGPGSRRRSQVEQANP